jgi:hypothetical protein
MHHFGRKIGGKGGFVVEFQQQAFGMGDGVELAVDMKMVAPVMNMHTQTLFDLFEVLMERAAQGIQPLRVLGAKV